MDCTAHGSINAPGHRVKSEKNRRVSSLRMLPFLDRQQALSCLRTACCYWQSWGVSSSRSCYDCVVRGWSASGAVYANH